MLKIKKKPFYLTLFLIFFSVLFFIQPFVSYVSGYFFRLYFERSLNAKIQYESIAFKKGSFYLKKLSIDNDLMHFEASKIKLRFALNLKAMNIEASIDLMRPQVQILKKNVLSNLHFNKKIIKPRRFFKTKINAEDGKIIYKDEAEVESFFCIKQKGSGSDVRIHFSIDPKYEHPFLIDYIGNTKEIGIYFEDIDISLYDPIFSFIGINDLLKVENIKGILSAQLNVNIKSFEVDTKIEGKDLYAEHKKTKNTFFIAKTKAKIKTESILFKNGLYEDLFSKLRMDISAEKAKVISEEKNVFLDNISTNIKYNPEMGINFSLTSLGIDSKGKNIPIDMQAKGFFSSNVSNWIDYIISFGVDDSIISLNVKGKEKNFLLKTNFKHLDLKYLSFAANFFKKDFLNIVFNNGRINLESDITISEGSFSKIDVKNLSCKQIDLIWRKKHFLKVAKIKCLGKTDVRNWRKAEASIEVNEGLYFSNFKGEKKEIEDIYLNFSFKNNKLFPSILSGNFDGIKTDIKFNGSLDDMVVNAEINGTTQKLLQHEHKDDISAFINGRIKNKDISISGVCRAEDDISKNQSFIFGIELRDLLNNPYKKSLKSFWFKSNNLSINKINFFLPAEKKVGGILSSSCYYQDGKLDINCAVKDLFYEDKYQIIKVDHVGDIDGLLNKDKAITIISFVCDINNTKITMPKFQGTYFLKKYGLSFDCFDVLAHVENSKAVFDLPKTFLGNINLGGRVEIDFSKEKKHPFLSVDILSAEGKAVDLLPYIKKNKMKQIKLDEKIKGEFFLNKKGARFSRSLISKAEDVFFSFDVNFSDIEYQHSRGISFSNISFDIDINNGKQKAKIDLAGDCSFWGENIEIKTLQISKRKNRVDYLCYFDKDLINILSLDGYGLYDEKGTVSLKINKKKSHFFQSRIKEFLCQIDNNYSVKKFDSLLDMDLKKITALFLEKKWPLNMKGHLLSHFQYVKNEKNNNCCVYQAHSKDLKINDKSAEKFDFLMNISNSALDIKKCQIDDLTLSLNSFFDQKKIMINDFKIDSKNISMSGKGNYFINDNKMDLKIDKLAVDISDANDLGMIGNFIAIKKIKDSALNFAATGWVVIDLSKNNYFETDLDISSLSGANQEMEITALSPLNFHYSSNDGLGATNINFSINSPKIGLYEMGLSCKFFSYDNALNKFIFEKGRIFVPKEFLNNINKLPFKNPWKEVCSYFHSFLSFDNNLESEINIEYYPKEKRFTSYTNKGTYSINHSKKELENICFSYQNKKFYAEFEYLHDENRHLFSSVTDLEGSNISGKISVGKDVEALTVYWKLNNNNIEVEKIAGKYCGIIADLSLAEKKSGSCEINLLGSLVLDFSQIGNLLTKEIKERIFSKINLGKGYVLKGNFYFDPKTFTFSKFEGSFIGKDFEVLDYHFKTLYTDLSFSTKDIYIKNFKISDIAGIVDIEEISLKKENDDWHFNLPIFKARDIRPSLLHKQKEKIKPLVLRNVEIKNLDGSLSDFSQIKGEGSLLFINSFKRGHSIFEVPAEMMGRIFGLDFELLIPVYGQVFFNIHDEKIFITEMKDVYSENNRSKFFLFDTPFISFSGDIDINIKMKQYVLFSITEKFVLSIQGNIKDPKFNMKKRKLFRKEKKS